MEFTFYEILGVKKTASEEEIRAAYKKLAKKYHPDKHAGNPVYEEHFKKINSAYQTLSNPDKRRRYDFKLEYALQQNSARPVNQKRPASPSYTKVYPNKSKPIDPQQVRKYRIYGALILAFVILFISGALAFYYYMNKVSARHHLEEAKKQEAKQNYVSALQEYTAAIKFNPDLSEAYEGRGDVRIGLWKDYSGAARDYSKALENPGKNFELYFKRAKAYLKQKEYDKGIQDLDSAIVLNSSYDSLYFYRAEVNHYIRHNFDKAIPDYKKVIELNKNFMDAWLGKALCLQGMGEYQKSIGDFNQLINFNEDQGEVFYYRAFSKLGLKDSSGACSDWFQAERLNFSEARSALNSYCTGSK